METKRLVLFSLGTVLLGVGAVGVVLPVLPTTPLVLASFFCFTKSSKRAERWILSNRYFGSYIENYQTKQGIPLDIKMKSIVFLWVTLTVSCYIFQDRNYLLIILPIVGLAVTLHIILIKTKKSFGNQTDPEHI